MILLSILALPHSISASLGGNDWFQHPSRVASENNGTNTKIHCQRFREAEQVNWWFKPAGERSWRTVKMYSKQDLSHVTKYDKYDRYSIDNRLGQYEGRVVYFYDLLIEPVTWADRGEWKCEFPDADIQSSPGKLNVDIPLTGVSFSSNGREYTNSTRGAPLVIDEGDDLTIWCRTSETFPSPKGLEIWIENEKLKNVQIQTHTKSDGMAQMSGSVVLKSVNREQYHEKSVKCIGQWMNSSSPDVGDTIKGVAMINVFFPAMDLVVRTEEVEFNRQLQAKCAIGQPANPKPEIIWYLDGKAIGNEQELKYDVDRSDDLKELKCVAIHKTFALEPREIKTSSNPTKIRVHYHSEPSSLTITKNEIESKIEFECITGRAYPHSVISMQIRSPSDEIIPYGSSISKLKKIKTLDGGFIVKRTLTLDGNNLDLHNSEVVCIESWRDENEPDFTQETRDQIKIKHAPKSVKVEGINNLTIGQNEIICFADGGYPKPNPDQFQLTIGRKIIPLLPSDDNGVVANVNLTLEDHNKTIKCSLSNGDQRLKTQPMKTEEKLNITYPVTDINMSLDKDIYDANEVVQIDVMTSSSYPKPIVSCYKEAISKAVVALETISNPSYEQVEPYGATYRAVFTFQATRFDDGAIISCRATNRLDDTATSIQVQQKVGVLTKAFFVANQVFEVAEGKKLSIPVEKLIRSNPPQQDISWYKTSDKKTPLVVATTDQSGLELTIDDVTRDHNGEYFVQSEDVSGVFNLIVLTAPKIRISGSTSVISGQNLDLTCYGEGIPAPKVYWVRDDVILSNGTELYIEAPNESDSGDYFCVASNSHSTNQKSVQVQIQYAPQLEVNSEIVVYPGDKNFPLECTVKAVPPVEEVFFVSPDGEKFMSTFAGGDRWTLTKWSPTLTAFGTWNCQAENKVNRVQANIEVIQAGPPEGIKDLTIDIIRMESGPSSMIKLKWSKGRSNGYEQKFRVRVKSADLAIGFDKEYKTQNGELVVRNLTINTDYDINIIAENEKGQSLPYNQIYAFDGVNKQTTTLYIYLISISVLILIVLIVVLFWHKRGKEFKYNTKKLESDTDRSSLPESESLVKQERLSAEYQLQRPSSENSFTDHRHSEGMYRYYTLQGNKRTSNLPDVAQLNHSMTSPNQFLNPDQLDYSPSGPGQSDVYDDHYGSTLCHRHHLKRNYDTMPKLIDTTSGYCSSSNSSQSQSQPVPRSQSFQHRRKTLKSEGVLV